MKKKTDWVKIGFAVFAVLLMALWPRPSLDGSDNPDQETILGEFWSITGVRTERTSQIDGIHGTDELIYVDYVAEPYIDVYDLSGAFQYTIQLPERVGGHGSLDLECRDGMLIAESEMDVVYLFRGTQFLESMDQDQARERGLLPDCRTKSPYVLTKTHVCRADGEALFELPPELKENLPRSLLTSDLQKTVEFTLVILLFAAAFVCIVGGFLRDLWRENRKRR